MYMLIFLFTYCTATRRKVKRMWSILIVQRGKRRVVS